MLKLPLPPEPVTLGKQLRRYILTVGVLALWGYFVSPTGMIGAIIGGVVGSLGWLAVVAWKENRIRPHYGQYAKDKPKHHA